MANFATKQTWVGKIQDVNGQYTANGTALVKMRVRYQQRNLVDNEEGEKEWKNVNMWSPDLAIWGASAEGAMKILKKDMTVFVETTYERQKVERDGETNYYHNFTVFNWQVLDWRASDDAEPMSVEGGSQEYADFDAEEDIPF